MKRGIFQMNVNPMTKSGDPIGISGSQDGLSEDPIGKSVSQDELSGDPIGKSVS